MTHEVAYTLPSKDWTVVGDACKQWQDWGLPEEASKFLSAVRHKIAAAVESDGKKTVSSNAGNWEKLIAFISCYPREWEASAEVLEVGYQLDVLSGDWS